MCNNIFHIYNVNTVFKILSVSDGYPHACKYAVYWPFIPEQPPVGCVIIMLPHGLYMANPGNICTVL